MPMSKTLDPSQRWFNSAQAAVYCGYSQNRFMKLVREYKVPRYGPERNRFDRQDLDEWMLVPRCFTNQQVKTFSGRRKEGGFMPLKRMSLVEEQRKVEIDVSEFEPIDIESIREIALSKIDLSQFEPISK